MFEVRKFNSGEYEVKLIERILSDFIDIEWNWFEEPDLMIILSKIKSVRLTYGRAKKINLFIPYFPYSRQDRVFETGTSIPFQTIMDIFASLNINKIVTYALHTNVFEENGYPRIENNTIPTVGYEDLGFNIIYPDANAHKHFYYGARERYNFEKVRTDKGIKLELRGKPLIETKTNKFLICDDILDGGRTFIECAKYFTDQRLHSIIEILVYHAFCTHGLDDLKAAGIKKINIINGDSFNAMIKKYPNDADYFQQHI